MIASYSHNFIFLKTRKTAGTSVEAVLSAWCSGKDIVTRFSAADEPLRAALGGKAMNYHRFFRKNFYNHMPAAEVRRSLPRLWDSSFRFTVERHPYELVVSRAYWWMHRYGRSDFTAEVENILTQPRYFDNRSIYAIDGDIAVHEVIAYDNLWPRLARIAHEKWGRTLPESLPRAKGSFRTDRRPASDILTDSQKARIFAATRDTFDRFGFAP